LDVEFDDFDEDDDQRRLNSSKRRRRTTDCIENSEATEEAVTPVYIEEIKD